MPAKMAGLFPTSMGAPTGRAASGMQNLTHFLTHKTSTLTLVGRPIPRESRDRKGPGQPHRVIMPDIRSLAHESPDCHSPGSRSIAASYLPLLRRRALHHPQPANSHTISIRMPNASRSQTHHGTSVPLADATPSTAVMKRNSTATRACECRRPPYAASAASRLASLPAARLSAGRTR